MQRNALTSIHVPAPTGGINTAEPGGAMPATDAVLADNVVANEWGARFRLGYMEHCTGLGGAVRSVIPFTGSTTAQTSLFATTPAGIYDVSTSSASPASEIAFGTALNDAGWGVSTTMVVAGGHYGFFADEENGLYRYNESTGAWTQPGDITGVDVTTIVFVMVWKNRLWMVQRDTGTAWYLATGAISGAATAFYFGNKFRAGGHLVGLWNWTADGGTGMDDYLVAASSGGDVVVYQGTDPASAVDFAMRGDWFVGALPAGRRVATDFGGEMLLLTQVGILPLSKLLSGQAINPAVYATRKIAGLFTRLMSERGALQGWSLRISPKDAALIVTVPDVAGEYTYQLAQSINTGGWSTFTGYPMLSNEAWNGDLYFGSPDGVVYKAIGGMDGVSRDGTTASATAVNASGLTSYQTLGSSKRKQATTIRPHWLGEGAEPEYAVEARYDYDTSPIDLSPTAVVASPGTWGVGLWGSTFVWGTGTATAYSDVRGAEGIGSAIAIGWKARSSVRTTLVGFDVAIRECGMY